MITQKGWATKIMLSLFKKEATYDAGVTMSDVNACTFTGFKGKVDWPDSVAADDDTISGYEFGTSQEILEQNVGLTISQERSHPNFVIGLAALTLGAISSAKDGANDAYTHTITPSASNASNPSIQGEVLCGAVQFAYKGLKADNLKISGDKGSYLKTECKMTGSGTRATSATAFAAAISEGWLKFRDSKIWIESGANISIDTTPAQGAENISSGTPTALTSRIQSFEFNWDNANEKQFQSQDIQPGRRKAGLKISVYFNDITEMNYYINQTNLAVELNLTSSTKIDADGALYYGIIIQVPRCRLKSVPMPDAGATGPLTVDLDLTILDDTVNDAVQITGFNAVAAYLAA